MPKYSGTVTVSTEVVMEVDAPDRETAERMMRKITDENTQEVSDCDESGTVVGEAVCYMATPWMIDVDDVVEKG